MNINVPSFGLGSFGMGLGSHFADNYNMNFRSGFGDDLL